MHRVGVLALDGVLPFELGIPARIFGAARDAAGKSLYTVTTCSLDGRPVRAEADYDLTVSHDASLLATVDTVVIPPSHALGPIRAEGRLPDGLRDALAAVRPGTRMVAICTGTYVLAAAGLLEGRPATTHWREADRLQRMFTTARVDPDVLFVDDGDILTSAGVAAGIDLCLHIVRRDHGSRIANEVARSCVVPPWRDGGQAQYIQRPVPDPAGNGTAPTRAWAMERLAAPLTLADLAAHAKVSVRTLTRRFREEVGLSPGQWLTRQRVDLARHLLETTDWPVDLVAHRAGFGTGTSMRQHLHAAIGVSPQAYRRTFRPTRTAA
ncbi:GlxA family transcriptional regulator [Streptomyces netropsis]|uniref:Transcriptional regulator GlxA family with amidase domain n=1 Tax=Streptomyces netropsis TaxID=55404 RepID=A0A7W7PGB7_STRNE|nr:helix-turn-helix domain-containing protein [Streptomyces netropsis]MBB4888063.1 transcriptional regulator GlxA family with amidase domain [Streptomyces netropsis]GGR32277.1 AraC family transcriptional regulator [Streptomyces netropsis]